MLCTEEEEHIRNNNLGRMAQSKTIKCKELDKQTEDEKEGLKSLHARKRRKERKQICRR
jgi:hypothetical protein